MAVFGVAKFSVSQSVRCRKVGYPAAFPVADDKWHDWGTAEVRQPQPASRRGYQQHSFGIDRSTRRMRFKIDERPSRIDGLDRHDASFGANEWLNFSFDQGANDLHTSLALS